LHNNTSKQTAFTPPPHQWLAHAKESWQSRHLGSDLNTWTQIPGIKKRTILFLSQEAGIPPLKDLPESTSPMGAQQVK
jgi:hypothetical protein